MPGFMLFSLLQRAARNLNIPFPGISLLSRVGPVSNRIIAAARLWGLCLRIALGSFGANATLSKERDKWL